MQTNRKFKFLWIRFCDIKENIEILDKFAPLKKKYIRANHSKFVTKELSKTMILRSKLRNQFLKTKSQESKMKYNKQRNLCISMTKTKSSYYENLDLIDITDRVSMKDVCTNLGIFGTPPPSPCPGLSTFRWPPHSPSPCRHKAGIIWNIATCEQFTLKCKKNWSFWYWMYTRVFLLGNFDNNNFPTDGFDHEVNVTHGHDIIHRHTVILYE